MEKRFKVRMELGMVITIGVDAADEQYAQSYAIDILKDKLCAPGNSDLYFCEIDDSDVYVNSADIEPLEVYESDD
jgi:hypothetical protein